jgi:RsiW-degrading membrane proteinase PrsW (M82 family)
MMLVGLFLGLLSVTPFVVTYVIFIRWCDRFEPEPWWLVLCAFVWGAFFATIGGGMSSGIVQALVENVTAAAAHDPDIEAFGATILAPVFEEGFKGLGVALIAAVSAMGLKELDGALDGAIYGGVIGLGFTLTEDILYVAAQFEQEGLGGFVVLLFLRTVLLGLSHCTFTACTGLGFGIAAESRSWFVKVVAPIGGYVCAMAMHAMHNGLPTFFGEEGLVVMVLLSWLIDILFFVILGVLVVRDRATIIRELTSEMGGLLHPRELQLVATYFQLGMRNWAVLFSRGWRAFSVRRRKQLALVELAFIKNRRRRGEYGRDLDLKEAKLRQEISWANRQGIWIGS